MRSYRSAEAFILGQVSVTVSDGEYREYCIDDMELEKRFYFPISQFTFWPCISAHLHQG